MDIFKLQHPSNFLGQSECHYSLAIGFFDGLHKGHFEVINQANKIAKEKGLRLAVMTFDPHPSHLFGDGKNKVGYITAFEEKSRLLKLMGVDTLFVVKFDHPLSSLTPAEFVEQFIKKIGVKHVTAGFDFTFGRKGAGTMDDMTMLSDGEYGTTVVGKVLDNADKISSTRIRELLSNGDVKDAAHLLGRNFRTIGTVVHGEKKGRELGFPTANVLPIVDSLLPANGVYAVRFSFEGETYDGVCNVGLKPTFNNPNIKIPLVEVYVLDFNGDLYGKKVTVDWIAHIRNEKKFKSLDELKKQIAKDKASAYEILHTMD